MIGIRGFPGLRIETRGTQFNGYGKIAELRLVLGQHQLPLDCWMTGGGWAEIHCLSLDSCRVRSSMQPSMCSMACLRATFEDATLCAEKKFFTSSRASAEQKLPVELTNMAPISVVNWAWTLSQSV